LEPKVYEVVCQTVAFCQRGTPEIEMILRSGGTITTCPGFTVAARVVDVTVLSGDVQVTRCTDDMGGYRRRVAAERAFDGCEITGRQYRRGHIRSGWYWSLKMIQCVVSLGVTWICLVSGQMMIVPMLSFLEMTLCIVVAVDGAGGGGSCVDKVTFTVWIPKRTWLSIALLTEAWVVDAGYLGAFGISTVIGTRSFLAIGVEACVLLGALFITRAW
jgi:hypothetical protein